jgi:hypothetical protein
MNFKFQIRVFHRLNRDFEFFAFAMHYIACALRSLMRTKRRRTEISSVVIPAAGV